MPGQDDKFAIEVIIPRLKEGCDLIPSVRGLGILCLIQGVSHL